ncbi:MAG TPA: leucyl/phenylalanyl-tRNA--protein transferase [Candidatus Competibacteraceae bacterium]|nr:leucyl/phenylalanyl-tRNA--protein transferase [Candidatus Competibacteraceae bacterium]
MKRLPWLDPEDDGQPFPNPDEALRDPNGLLAVGGSLTPERLLNAYRQGIFPWFGEGQPILWWSPDPRAVLFPERIKVSRSLRKRMRNAGFQVTLDRAFAEVIRACAAPRRDGPGTWITADMERAYCRLHRLGHAHSVETWYQGRLVGGLYGVAVGRVFYGESMFSHMNDASKVALVRLCRQLEDWGFGLIDCQMSTAHLLSMGAEEIPRRVFLQLIERFGRQPDVPSPWQFTLYPACGDDTPT